MAIFGPRSLSEKKFARHCENSLTK